MDNYFVDSQEEADKVHTLGWGRETITLSKEQIEYLLQGKIMVWCDGEYTHQIEMEK